MNPRNETVAPDPSLTPVEARTIAEEAFVYAYPFVHGYRAIHWLGVRKGGFNRLGHYRKIVDPGDDLNMEVQINLDTLYTQVPLDLRAEPLLLTIPPFTDHRYFSVQFSDLYMHNYAYLGTRPTGQGGGRFLLAGPDWQGEVPAGITAVVRSETNICYSVIRILCLGKADQATVNAIQDGFQLVSCIKLTVDMRAFDAHAPLLSKSPQHFLSIRTVFYLRYVFR